MIESPFFVTKNDEKVKYPSNLYVPESKNIMFWFKSSIDTGHCVSSITFNKLLIVFLRNWYDRVRNIIRSLCYQKTFGPMMKNLFIWSTIIFRFEIIKIHIFHKRLKKWFLFFLRWLNIVHTWNKMISTSNIFDLLFFYIFFNFKMQLFYMLYSDRPGHMKWDMFFLTEAKKPIDDRIIKNERTIYILCFCWLFGILRGQEGKEGKLLSKTSSVRVFIWIVSFTSYFQLIFISTTNRQFLFYLNRMFSTNRRLRSFVKWECECQSKHFEFDVRKEKNLHLDYDDR